VTRASLREYAAVQRERYQQANRREKHQLLDEIVAVTGIHRKAAIRLLRRQPRAAARPPRTGRPRQYGPEIAAAAEVVWQASGRIGAARRATRHLHRAGGRATKYHGKGVLHDLPRGDADLRRT
jgi:hypothetical protein